MESDTKVSLYQLYGTTLVLPLSLPTEGSFGSAHDKRKDIIAFMQANI